MKWVRRASGYYESCGYSGIAVTLSFEHGRWFVFAGDRTMSRTDVRTLREAKQWAEKMFG